MNKKVIIAEITLMIMSNHFTIDADIDLAIKPLLHKKAPVIGAFNITLGELRLTFNFFKAIKLRFTA